MTAVSMAAAAAATYVASGGGSRLGRPSSSSCGDDNVAGGGDNSDTNNRDSFGNGDALAPLPMMSDGGTANNVGETGASLPQQQQQQQQQQQINQHGFSPLHAFGNANNNNSLSCMIPQHLPKNPQWSDVFQISDFIVSWSNCQFQQQQEREELLIFLSAGDCGYVRKLLALYRDYNNNDDHDDDNYDNNNPHPNAAELATVVKSILLLNDPEIIEYVTTHAPTFERICAVLEHDPELRRRADHLRFLSDRARFRTVVRMDDEELVGNVHRLFRVNYLRDVVLRPTMDEGSLSTLVSLGQFTMSDIVKGVVVQNCGNGVDGVAGVGVVPNENYLIRVIRMLGRETRAVRRMEWEEHDGGKTLGHGGETVALDQPSSTSLSSSPSTEKLNDNAAPTSAPQHPVGMERTTNATTTSRSSKERSSTSPPTPATSPSAITWQQHLAPQDPSLSSRRIRRRGCLCFLNELFNMARMSLQQHEKDDFIETTVTMTVPLLLDEEGERNEDETAGGTSKGGADDVNATIDNNNTSNDNYDNNNNNNNRPQQIEPLSVRVDQDGITSPTSPPTVTSSQNEPQQHVNLLSLLGAVLSDPTTDSKERGASLEILSVVAMHDPGLIRKYCLDYNAAAAAMAAAARANPSSDDASNAASDHVPRPAPNDSREVLFLCPPDDLFLSLLFVMATETDAGLLLQTSEIVRIVLDTEMTGGMDQGGGSSSSSPLGGGGGFMDEENDSNAANNNDDDGGMAMGHPNNANDVGENAGPLSSSSGPGASSSASTVELEQNSFLALFYDRYVPWLVAPFQYEVLAPRRVSPLLPLNDGHGGSVGAKATSRDAVVRIRREFERREDRGDSSALEVVRRSPVRSSFTLEILSFCVRAHVHRMKFFLLRSRLLGTVLKVLCQKDEPTRSMPTANYGDDDVAFCTGFRCLKLASLKLFRSVLSVKDEFYHRHIVQYNLFAPIFDLFRATPSVGSNLLSSAILEMCDFICIENIKSLIDCIVLKHLSKSTATSSATTDGNINPSLEDIANPHVDTFKQLRKAYGDNNSIKPGQGGGEGGGLFHSNSNVNVMNGNHDGLLMNGQGRSILNKKGLEDQRKFREADEEESYFNEDDSDTELMVGVTANAAPSEQKLPMPTSDHDMTSLMEDVKSLDQ